MYRLAPSIHQSSELIQLGAGDLKGSLEVDPLDHLKATWGGQAAIVCAVSGACRGHHGVNEGVQLEAGVREGNLAPGGGDLAQGVSQGLQRRVLRLKYRCANRLNRITASRESRGSVYPCLLKCYVTYIPQY